VKIAAPSPLAIMMLPWPWAKFEWRAVCAERCTYGSGRRSATALLTPLRTLEGFAYLAVVIDLFSRRVVRWSMQSRQTTEVVLQALLMAVWRRKSKNKVLIHSDQGSQFTSVDWASFLRAHNLAHSMSRRGNCHDNAIAESFFNLLKRERVRRRTYKTREDARRDVFDYIEMFYNPRRKHVRNWMLSPIEFERQQKMKAEGV
ncbi:MAG: IS3 family transposase, partial [Rhodobacteraceae bacterium]|nr:IS3 family transposase [Paracoccaceae bacterium]